MDIASVKVLASHGLIKEPELAFHPGRPEDHHPHPLAGLVEFGPYSRSTVNHVLDPIRVATVAASDQDSYLTDLLQDLERTHAPRERRQYLIDFVGMSRTFGVRVVLASKDCHVRLGPEVDKEILGAAKPHTVLARKLTESISLLSRYRAEFDVLLLALPDRWAPAFYGGDLEDFDLHDYLKAITASSGLPLQILRESRVFTYPCRCSVGWRLSIALYCKAGGIPWKLAATDPETAYVGLTYALRSSGSADRFVTCCSQVFDADGTGLEFIAYEARDAVIEDRNPFLSRSDMRRVMARSLALYQRRHAGAIPKRVVVHKSTPYKPDEMAGCLDAWTRVPNIELIQVQQDTPWRAIELSGNRQPSGYPCQRGSYLQLTEREALLWTQGNLSATLGKNFFKEGKGIPSPLALIRFAGHGAYYELCSEVLGLTKMNWNNDSFYDRLPVTMSFASVLARTVKRMPSLEPRPYQVRFLM